MKSPKLLPFEYRIFRRLQAAGVREQTVLVACSGGRDSLALVVCLAALAKRLDLKLEVAHVHHGWSSRPRLRRARKAAAEKVEQAANELALPFHLLGSPTMHRRAELKSEEKLREFRRQSLSDLARARQCRWIALAHHADDLFETRLIRLLRGTGPQGLTAMRGATGAVLRPFLQESRVCIAKYAEQKSLHWCEDPTNAEAVPLRNWIRLHWLPVLEKKRPGATAAFARSLENLAASFESVQIADSVPAAESSAEIDRRAFSSVSVTERRQILAALLRKLGAKNFSTAHIEEIRKRIESSRRSNGFRLLDLDWRLKSQSVIVQRQSASSPLR